MTVFDLPSGLPKGVSESLGRPWPMGRASALIPVPACDCRGSTPAAAIAIGLAVQPLIVAGFWLLSASWHVLYHAQRVQVLATGGPYARIRHPQYLAFVLILFGFLLQWPTILTLLMFPVLLVMYGRLAVTEERDMDTAFGEAWRAYAARTPRFLPDLSPRTT